jgi:hypothetical protein
MASPAVIFDKCRCLATAITRRSDRDAPGVRSLPLGYKKPTPSAFRTRTVERSVPDPPAGGLCDVRSRDVLSRESAGPGRPYSPRHFAHLLTFSLGSSGRKVVELLAIGRIKRRFSRKVQARVQIGERSDI